MNIEGLVITFISLILILFRKYFAKFTINFQNNVFKRNFSINEIEATQKLALLIGVLGIILGILIAFGILKKAYVG